MSIVKQFFVFFHSPGPAWKPGTGFRDQPGIGEHVEDMRSLLDQGTLIMGGPFLDDSGGMAVYELPDADIANAKATEDPTVQSGLLNVKVRPWLVPFSRDQI